MVMTLVSSYPKIGNLGPTDVSERNKGEVGQPRWEVQFLLGSGFMNQVVTCINVRVYQVPNWIGSVIFLRVCIAASAAR
jgi:hypothetical protein